MQNITTEGVAFVGLAIVVIALAIALLRTRLALIKLAVLASEAEKELKTLKAAPRIVESRIDRFDLLWFPQFTVLKEPPHIVSVSAGLPHCRACVSPLKLQAGSPEAWVCPDCGGRHPGSLADTMVTDSVTQQAVKEFLQRNKGYRLAPRA